LVQTEIKFNRLSHTATPVGSYLVIFGGHNGQTYSQDVLFLNLGKSNFFVNNKVLMLRVTLQWESKTPKGVLPAGRGYHIAILHDARILIFGGYNGVTIFNDLWTLELSAAAYLPQVVSCKSGHILVAEMSQTTFAVDETRTQLNSPADGS
jgi:hypothetical protein